MEIFSGFNRIIIVKDILSFHMPSKVKQVIHIKNLPSILLFHIKTINYHIIAIRAFLKFCIRHDIPCISPDKLEISKTPPREVHFLNDEEIEKILQAPDEREKAAKKRIRDNAIIQILYGS